jgi:Cu+-exporting ATPase
VIGTIESVGYGARVHTVMGAADDTLARLRRRLVVAIALGLPVLLLSMIRPCSSTAGSGSHSCSPRPLRPWAAWPFHRAMVLNLRHRQATMDTLISVGVIAAYGWSLWALLFTDAGKIGETMTMGGGGDTPEIYLEVASAGRRLHPCRPLLRSARQAPRRRCHPGPARSRRQGRGRARRRRQRAACAHQ